MKSIFSDASLNKNVSVCHTHHVIKTTLTQFDSIALSLWYTQGTSYKASCYFYCTNDGKIPAKATGTSAANNVLSEIVRRDRFYFSAYTFTYTL